MKSILTLSLISLVACILAAAGFDSNATTENTHPIILGLRYFLYIGGIALAIGCGGAAVILVLITLWPEEKD